MPIKTKSKVIFVRKSKPRLCSKDKMIAMSPSTDRMYKCFSKYKKKPVYILYLDARSAFDLGIRHLLINNL